MIAEACNIVATSRGRHAPLTQEVPSTWTKDSRGVEPLHPLGVLQQTLPHTPDCRSEQLADPASRPNKGV
jgi:hypothetical protein